jgi:hypothetical protein
MRYLSSTALKADMIDTIKTREDKYVFINFNYKLKSKYMFEQGKLSLNYLIQNKSIQEKSLNLIPLRLS